MLKQFSQLLKYNQTSKLLTTTKCFLPSLTMLAVGQKPNRLSVFNTKSYNFSTTNSNIPKQQISNIFDVKTIQDWQKLIKETTIPIVLDCYAQWCGPCKKLTPVLEEKAKNAKGNWVLAKFDIDEIPQLASALKLKSVPTVVLIHGGNAIDAFEGFPTDQVLQSFFSTLEKLTGLSYNEEETQKIFEESIKQINKGSFSDAIRLLKELSEQEQWLEKHGAKTYAALSLAYIRSGDEAASINHLSDLKTKFESDLENPEVKKLVQEIEQEFSRKQTGSSKLDEIKSELDKHPENNELRYQYAEIAYESGAYEQAIQSCIDILKIDRNWENKKAQKFLVEIFAKLGATNPLVVDGRKKMQRILY